MKKNFIRVSSTLAFTALIITLTAACATNRWPFTDSRFASDPSRGVAANPVSDAFDIFVNGIYKSTDYTKKFAIDIITPFYINYKLEDYLKTLPLDSAVKRRVLARVNSKEFMDDAVPFLLTLKDQYSAPQEIELSKFDVFFRDKFKNDKNIPGLEHSMFKWAPDGGAGDGPIKMDKNIIAKLITVYDAIFIQHNISPIFDDIVIDDAFLARVNPTAPVRDLIEALKAPMDPKGEIAQALEGILADENRLQAVTISLIQAVNYMGRKAYKAFAQRVIRAGELKNWLVSELDKKQGGKLFDYLKYAQRERHYGIHVVVDGLQGHLAEGLTQAGPQNRFVSTVFREHITGQNYKAVGRKVGKPEHVQQVDFLRFINSNKFAHPNYMSFFKRMYLRPYGIAQSGIATTPTISVRNLPIAKTGANVAGPKGTGIPNFHFVDRNDPKFPNGRAYYFFGNDALLLEKLTRDSGMTTMFQRLSGVTNLNCNAQYDELAKEAFDGFINLGLGEKLRDFGDLLCYNELLQRAANEKKLVKLREQILEYEDKWKASFWNIGLKEFRLISRKKIVNLIEKLSELEDQGLPQYLLYYNPWPDHFAHFKGPFSDEIISPSGEYNRLDYWLGKYYEVYERSGLAPRTLLGMAGDHGLTPVYQLVNPEIEIFDRLKEQGIEFKIEKISSDEGEGPKLNNALHPPPMKGFDVIVASTGGGNYMLDFFIDQNKNWGRQPIYSELTELTTLAGQKVDVVKESLESLSDTLDYMAIREDQCKIGDCRTRLVAMRDGQRVDVIVHHKNGRYFVEQEFDLLELRTPSPYRPMSNFAYYSALLSKCIDTASVNSERSWCTEDEWRELTSFTPRPDSVVQIAHLYDHDRAGTINLFPKLMVGYNSLVPGRHAGDVFHEKDAFVGFFGQTVKTNVRLPTAVNGGLAPTIYEFITGKPIAVGQQGWGFPSYLQRLEK